MRLPLTPLTNRYFVFCSAALREKSAVIFKSIPSQSHASGIFEEYASICAVGFHTINLHDNPSTSQLKICMKYLNAAALTNCWVNFEHL